VQIRTRRFGFTVMTTGSQNPVGTCPQSLLQESRVSGCANVIHWNCMTCVTLPVLWPALNRDVMHRIIRTCSPCSIACHLAISVRSMPVTPGQEDPLQALCNPEWTQVGKDPRRCQKKKSFCCFQKNPLDTFHRRLTMTGRFLTSCRYKTKFFGCRPCLAGAFDS
jgi:hypothetical protein